MPSSTCSVGLPRSPPALLVLLLALLRALLRALLLVVLLLRALRRFLALLVVLAVLSQPMLLALVLVVPVLPPMLLLLAFPQHGRCPTNLWSLPDDVAGRASAGIYSTGLPSRLLELPSAALHDQTVFPHTHCTR